MARFTTVRSSPDSKSDVVIQMGFIVSEYSEGHTREIGPYSFMPIPPTEYLQSISVELTAEGAWTATVEMFDASGDFLEDLILATKGTRKFLFSWDWDDNQSSASDLKPPIMVGGINAYKPRFTPEGIGITLEMTSVQALDSVLDKKSSRSFPKGTKLSLFAKSIADERGWDTQQGTTIDTSDEPSKVEGSWSTSSDVSILKALLNPPYNLRNKDGRVYRCYFDAAGVFHFHPSDFLEPRIVRTYTYARDANGTVLSFEPESSSIEAALLGSSEAVYMGTDSVSGTAQTQETNTSKGPKGTTLPVYDDAEYADDLGAGVKAKIIIPSRDRQEFEDAVAVAYERMRDATVSADMSVVGTHEFKVCDYVEVIYTTKKGQTHYLSGVYRVNKIRHTLNNSGWETDFGLNRSGNRYGENLVRFGVETANQRAKEKAEAQKAERDKNEAERVSKIQKVKIDRSESQTQAAINMRVRQ